MSRKSKAFTTIELVIILAVIGILAAILIPAFSNVIIKANAKSAITDARHTAEQYVMNVFEKKNAPETMVIVVNKGGSYWLFGYNRDSASNGNRLMISKQNPYTEAEFMKNDTLNSVMDKWSFNAKRQGTEPDATGATQYAPQTDGTFWLVPYYDNGAKVYEVRTVPSYDDEMYMLLNTSSSSAFVGEKDINASYAADGEELSADGEIVAYHGLLLPGTFTYDEEDVDTTGSDGTDYSLTTYSLSFLMGDTEGKFNPTDYGTTLPATVQIPAGTTVYPSAYTITNAPAAYTYSWDRTTAFVMNRNVTLTAVWTERPTYSVSFNVGSGEEFDSESVTAAKTAMEGTGFKWTEITTGAKLTKIKLESGSAKLYSGTSIAAMFAMTASRDGFTFRGWKTETGNTINASSGATEKTVTGNLDFNAVFTDDTQQLHVYIDANNGNTSQNIDAMVNYGSTLNLSTSALHIDAPTGKVLGYWSWSLSGTQFSDGATVTLPNDSSITEVTFTAHWVNDELIVQYATEVPQKATTAGISATVPATATYSSGDRPAGETISVGGASLSWYTVSSYTIVYPGGSQTLTVGTDTMTFSTSGISSGTILITPNYTAMTATIQYRSGGYNVDNWAGLVPAATTYDLIDIRSGYTVCTNNLTCNEGYRFEGWLDSADMNASHIYAASATYSITESKNGSTITFIAYFNEEVMATACRVVFNFYDYQNYHLTNTSADDAHILYSSVANVPFNQTLNGTLMSENMPTSAVLANAGITLSVSSAAGSSVSCGLGYSYDAERSGDYTPITVTASTPQDTVVWIPSYKIAAIGGVNYIIIDSEYGFRHIDHGSYTVDGQPINYSMSNNYALSGNISLSSSNMNVIGRLGISAFRYKGHFNGLGYTVSGLTISEGTGINSCGLFGCIGGGTGATGIVENFRLVVSSVNSGSDCVGAITGANEGIIRNIEVDLGGENSIRARMIVGGICGWNKPSGVIENCHVVSTVNSAKTIVSTRSCKYDSHDQETISYSNNETRSGTFIGGITGLNEGRITLSSASGKGSGVYLGLHPNQVGTYTDANGYVHNYYAQFIGGIAGSNAGGMIDQCWAYKVDLCRAYYITTGTSFNTDIAGIQSVAGIAGINECSATIQYCWTRNVHCTAELAAGGIAGMNSTHSSITNCWSYFGGAEVAAGNTIYVGDIVSSYLIGGTASLTNCAIWDSSYPDTIPADSVSSQSTLSDISPASVGLNTTYFEQNGNGPMLINNPYNDTWFGE